jgi:hypothetical protein
MSIDNYMFDLNDALMKWQNNYLNNKIDFNYVYSDNTSNPKNLQLGHAQLIPNSINWIVSSAANINSSLSGKYWSSTSCFYTDTDTDPSTEMKNNIIKIIKKIIDGGKTQLIFSLKSEDELEIEIAKLLLNLIGVWRTSSEEDNNGTRNEKSN